MTADTCHGLLTGDETRQQAYTMLTRGRMTNSAYLVTVGDGDPHSLIHPETLNPHTATDQLEKILARDESPISATTTLRQAGEPARLLGAATDRYRDAIVFASAQITPEIERRTLERSVERWLPGVTRADAWPALFSQLLTIAADNRDPFAALARVAADPLPAGRDPAATLAGRLDDTAHHRVARGPLPWLNPIPAKLVHDPHWGAYLAARADRVSTIALQVHDAALASTSTPSWVGDAARPPSRLIADIEVWRASNSVPETDRRPTGEHQHGGGPGRHQRSLERQLANLALPALDEWGDLLRQLDPSIGRDDYIGTLATRLARLASVGIDARTLLGHAMDGGALPDDHAAAALWWRISARLSPAVAQSTDTALHLAANWLPDLKSTVGDATYDELRASTWWPALVTAVEHGLQRGWKLQALIDEAPGSHEGLVDTCQSWVWRLTLVTSPLPIDDAVLTEPVDDAPDDLHVGWHPAGPVIDMLVPDALPGSVHEQPDEYEDDLDDPDREADRIIAFEAIVRRTMQPPEPTATEIRRQQDRANAWHECPYTPERLAFINELATQFYEARLPRSWAQPYLTERLRQDITGHPAIRPGYAPDGWTTLVDHLRRQGVTDHEMLTAGVATAARNGRLIDRFRDRVVFPIVHDGQVLGFVGRRNPEHPDDGKHGPKYLNTADTPLFHKGDQLYIVGDTQGARAVLVEGPVDAIAVAIATGGGFFGAAPLGTGLAGPQARRLVRLDAEPIVATDADPAGRAAAERDYWILAPLIASPRIAELPNSLDPADLVRFGAGEALAEALETARPLVEHLIESSIRECQAVAGLLHAAHTLAGAPPEAWVAGAAQIARESRIPIALVRAALASAVQAWNHDPLQAASLWGQEGRARAGRSERQVPVDGRLKVEPLAKAPAEQHPLAESIRTPGQPR